MEFDTTKLKVVQIELLKNFIQICNKYDLQYYMAGGSCLGAVRHKGFIPWDDDIDVLMPRSDYDTFMDIAQKELPKNLFLQTFKTDPDYYMCYAKIRNSDTTFIETPCKNININHGVYIDIFPLDGFTENKFKQKMFFAAKAAYQYRISKVFYLPDQHPESKSLFKKVLKELIMSACKDLHHTVCKCDRLFRKYGIQNSELVASHNGAWAQKEIMPKSYFGKGTKGIFEDIQVILPEKYDAYLTALYGDYMTPPPLEKQISHHYCEVIDTERAYTYYRNDI